MTKPTETIKIFTGTFNSIGGCQTNNHGNNAQEISTTDEKKYRHSLQIEANDAHASESTALTNDPLWTELEAEANNPLMNEWEPPTNEPLMKKEYENGSHPGDTENAFNGCGSIRSKGFQNLRIAKVLAVGIAITLGVIIGFTVMPRNYELGNLEHLKAETPPEVSVQYFGTTENRIQSQNLNQGNNNAITSAITNTTRVLEEKQFSQPNLMQVSIFSNLTTIPKASLDTKIILTINVTKIYNWEEEWKIANPDSIHSLVLIGPFNMASIGYFIKYFSNIKTLELSDGRYLCDEWLGDYEPLPGIYLPTRLQSLKLTSIGLPCENLYKFLVDILKLFNILELALKDVSIQYENIESFRKFLSIHRDTLKTLSFDNVNICGNTDCALFDDLKFPELTEAKLYFSRRDMDSCKKSLTNFNFASENIFSFRSNVQCLSSERLQYVLNWRQLRLEAASDDLCFVI